MALVAKQLGQLRPANTTAVSIYSPASGTDARLTQITICNTSSAAATFRLFHDDNGSTYDETSALYWNITIAANDTVTITLAAYMDDDTGSFAGRSSVGSALTFTLYGIEETA